MLGRLPWRRGSLVTEIKDQPAEPAGAGRPAGQDLEVAIARDLLEQARASGVSLAGPGGLLAGVTRRVLQAALDAEMTEHLGYEKGDRAGRGSREPPQRDLGQDGADRDRPGSAGGSPGP
jgi:hypothetical protein